MKMYHTLDLYFLGLDEAIGCFLIESDEGPILIECGPYSTFESMKTGLGRFGYQPEDVKHIFLTHIHFDHAGAAWAFSKEGANIYLHPFGASHMHDPSKLVASAKMIYGDDMDRLWGKMEGIAESNLKTVQHGEVIKIGQHSFESLHTPGHAKHHIAWRWGDTIFTGDVAGCKIGDGPVVPPCPPPDIDLEAWNNSIDLILKKNPKKLVLTHFDEVLEVLDHMNQLKSILNDWGKWMKTEWEKGRSAEEITPDFMNYTNNQLKGQGVAEEDIKKYEAANPAWMSVAGLMRYWKKRIR